MFKQLFKLLLFIPIIILDGTLLAMLPGSNYFVFSIAVLVLLIYKEDQLFSKFKWLVAILLGLFSTFPWYVFVGLILLWVMLVRYIAGMMFAAKSLPSLVIFYLVSYGLFDVLYLAIKIIQNFLLKETFLWTWLWAELKFDGVGLLLGAVTVAIIYSIGNYFEKKFKSFFFVRRRGY